MKSSGTSACVAQQAEANFSRLRSTRAYSSKCEGSKIYCRRRGPKSGAGRAVLLAGGFYEREDCREMREVRGMQALKVDETC